MPKKEIPQGWMNAREAMEYLRVSSNTLTRLDGYIQPARTPGGHRRYNVRMLNEYLKQSRR